MYAGGYFGQLYFAGGIDLYNLLLLISDDGSSLDDIAILNRVPITDDLTSSETLALVASFILQETTSGDDIALGKNINNLSDTGEALETISNLLNTLSIQETTEGSDEVSASNTFILSDDDSISENVIIAVYKTFLESATASEILNINNQFTLSETASSDDVEFIMNCIDLPDTGEATDLASVIVQNVLNELGSILEQLSIYNSFSLSEVASSDEDLTITATLSLTDSGSLVDSFSILNRVPISDLGSAIDSVISRMRRALLKVSVKTDKPGYIISVSTNKIENTSVVNDSLAITVNPNRYASSTTRNRSTGGFAYMMFGGMAFASAPEPVDIEVTSPRTSGGELKVSNKPSTISIKDIL